MEEIKPIEKKSFWKKKFIGIPMFLLILMGVILVVALTYIAYNHSFIKTIHVFDGDTGTIQIIGLGDIGNSVINCDRTSSICTSQTGEITLRNSDEVSHTCNIQTAGSDSVDVSYTNGIVEGNNTITSGDTTFIIEYTSNVVGDYPMTTTINCP